MHREPESRAFYSGGSGLILPQPNKQSYPPEYRDKSRLSYYSSLFNSIEVNSSFYKVPQAATLRKWASSVPDQFRFTFKLWREITHNKGLIFNEEDVVRFLDTIDAVGEKKACLLIQFPPSLGVENSPQLENLLNTIRKADEESQWKLAVEFRNRSWYHEETYELLAEYGARHVWHDMPASAPPFPQDPGPFLYMRFHGPNGGYRGTYTNDFLYEYGQYIREWMEEDCSIYAYFNNTMGGAVQNLMTLNEIVDEEMLG